MYVHRPYIVRAKRRFYTITGAFQKTSGIVRMQLLCTRYYACASINWQTQTPISCEYLQTWFGKPNFELLWVCSRKNLF